MGDSRRLEIMVGLFVAAGLAALFFLSMKVSNLTTYETGTGYEVTARFDNIGGLKVRSPVKVAGVTVGRVESIDYDMETFQAVVTLSMEPGYDTFPEDTGASIYTSGLLGEQYIGLQPGAESRVLEDGDEIRITQSALVLERIIGQFLFNKAAE